MNFSNKKNLIRIQNKENEDYLSNLKSKNILTDIKQHVIKAKTQKQIVAKKKEEEQQQIKQSLMKQFLKLTVITIQTAWRNYLIKKQRKQQSLIKQMFREKRDLEQLIEIKKNKNFIMQKHLSELRLKKDTIIEEQIKKQQKRIYEIAKKTINHLIDDEIKISVVESEVQYFKDRISKSQQDHQILYEELINLESQERQFLRKEKQYLATINTINKKILEENLQRTRLSCEKQVLIAEKEKLQKRINE